MSSLSGSVPSRHILYFWRCTKLLPEVSLVFDRTESVFGEIFSTSVSLPEVSLEARPPREFSQGFGIIKASFWRFTKLLPGVSAEFDRTEIILGGIFFTSASLPEVSLEARPPVSSLSGSVPSRHLFGAVPNYHRRSLQYFFQKLLLGRSLPRALPLMFSRRLAITELSLRTIVDCRSFCSSFDVHAGWVREPRGARSLNLLFCFMTVFNVDKQLDVWDVWAETWG